ncbi:MAG: type II toxin-antitoxin system RelE family toxin [Acidimicrobiales bacterium]
MKHVELTRRAEKDLRQLDKPARVRIADGLRRCLAAEPQPENVDVKPLVGAEPWLRLRVGLYRVLYRPLAPDELSHLLAELPEDDRPDEGYLVERIIHRRDLDRTAECL